MTRTILTAMAAALVAAACGSGTEPSPDLEYEVVQRPWAPGERAAQIALVKQYNALGMATDLVDSLFPQDWISEIVPVTPAAASLRGGNAWLQPGMAAPTAPGMIVVGMDMYVVDTSTYVLPEVPSDSILWLMVFWYDAGEPTYNGFTVVYSASATTAPSGIALNTTAWEAAGHYSGGGGGEIRASTSQFWLATSGDMSITFNSARAAAGSTVASGPFTGGIQRSGLMRGKLFKVRLDGSTTQALFTLDFSKSTTAIPAARLECWYPTPCTGAYSAPAFRAVASRR